MAGVKFPETGLSSAAIDAAMAEARANDADQNSGRVVMGCYHVSDEHTDVQDRAYIKYLHQNALLRGDIERKGGQGFFPSLARFDAEVVEMALGVLNAPEGAAGVFTSGGTESVLMAVLLARDWARQHRPEVTRPVILMPRTAHPAFTKGAHYFGLETLRIPQGPDFCADITATKAAMTDDVVLVVGSAPCYPFGVVDPIAELSEMAATVGAWMHVDACVGGYVLPFARKLGYEVPEFDFQVPGVFSISADLHKFGYTPKDASTILFRSEAMKSIGHFGFSDWPFGSYNTDTLGGSHTGGSMAAAWASMRHLGEAGYLDATKRAMGARDVILDAVRSIDGLVIHGTPRIPMASYGSNDPALDITAVAEGLKQRGWLFARGITPNAVHFALAPIHDAFADTYAADLHEVVAKARAGEITASDEDAVYA